MSYGFSNADAKALALFLGQADAALFVGSGVSLWSGLPTWPRFIQALIDHAARLGKRVGMAQAAIKDGRLADAADTLDLTPLEIADVMRRDLGFSDARPHRIHQLLTALGPERFITTNYDTLIEQQLGLQGRIGGYRTVTASRVAEMADILKASANRFVFKPHGEVGDADTMIVSARDYERVILGAGNLVRQGLETLLISRPVLFIGFGLRDPDLNLVLRSVTDRYSSNIHHFYAIVADLTDEERDYWWQRFRVRAFGYSVVRQGGNEDHSALLGLLDAVIAATKAEAAPADDARSKKSVLAKIIVPDPSVTGPRAQLTRYAASIVRERDTQALDLRGMLHDQWNRWPDERINQLHNASLVTILQRCPTTMVLVGQAGSGKSHAIREYLSVAGMQLLSWLTADSDGEPPAIPILLDARLYEGDFSKLLAASIPYSERVVAWSAEHRIDIIIDSIDEMPQEHLDDAGWRADLAHFVERFSQFRLIYGSRRSPLVGDPQAAAFYILGLRPDDITQQLIGHGLAPEGFTTSLKDEVTTPFELALMIEFGPMVGSSRSIAQLLDTAIEHYISRVPERFDFQAVGRLLRGVAYRAVIAGRETIAIANVIDAIGEDARFGSDPSDHRDLLESIVRSGIMISEVEAQLRFVHRSITEYLCSTQILALLESGETDLATLLANRRWDDPLTWSLSSVDGVTAASLLPQIYGYDPVLACRIVVHAERDTGRWWNSFVECLLASPPDISQVYSLIYIIGVNDLPAEAIPEIKRLATRSKGEIRGGAWRLYAAHANDDEIFHWLDDAAEGLIDFNESQLAASQIGAHLSRATERHFRTALLRLPKAREEEDAHFDDAGETAARCYAKIITGFDNNRLRSLLKWSWKQPEAVRSNLCMSLFEIDLPAANKFITQQFDCANYGSCFGLYMKASQTQYHREGKGLIVKFTQERFQTILRWVEVPSQARWSLALLSAYLRHSLDWQQGVRDNRKMLDKKQLYPVRYLMSDTTSARKLSFVKRSLARPGDVSAISRAVIRVLSEEQLVLPEHLVLGALTTDFESSLKLLQDWFQVWRGVGVEISVTHIDAWLALIGARQTSKSVVNEMEETRLYEFLAKAWSFDGREKILAIAEDQDNLSSNLTLAKLVPRLTGFSFGELSAAASMRLLEFYLKGLVSEHRQLGRAATEDVVDKLVVPRARARVPGERARLGLFLEDAGEVLGRRYALPD